MKDRMGVHRDADMLYGTLWEHALIGMAIVDQQGRFLSANPTFCKLMEYTEAELKTKRHQEITHPDDVAYDELMAAEVVVGKIRGYDMPKRYLTKFGRVIHILLRVAAIRQGGEFMYFLSQVAPLSEQQIHAPQVEQSMERARRKAFWRAVTHHWAPISFGVGLVASLVVQILQAVG